MLNPEVIKPILIGGEIVGGIRAAEYFHSLRASAKKSLSRLSMPVERDWADSPDEHPFEKSTDSTSSTMSKADLIYFQGGQSIQKDTMESLQDESKTSSFSSLKKKFGDNSKQSPPDSVMSTGPGKKTRIRRKRSKLEPIYFRSRSEMKDPADNDEDVDSVSDDLVPAESPSSECKIRDEVSPQKNYTFQRSLRESGSKSSTDGHQAMELYDQFGGSKQSPAGIVLIGKTGSPTLKRSFSLGSYEDEEEAEDAEEVNVQQVGLMSQITFFGHPFSIISDNRKIPNSVGGSLESDSSTNRFIYFKEENPFPRDRFSSLQLSLAEINDCLGNFSDSFDEWASSEEMDGDGDEMKWRRMKLMEDNAKDEALEFFPVPWEDKMADEDREEEGGISVDDWIQASNEHLKQSRPSFSEQFVERVVV